MYGTNYEYVFDYLKDNLLININNKIQKKLNFAIIDEIDSVLIDDSKIPLIISEKGENNSYYYKILNKVISFYFNKKYFSYNKNCIYYNINFKNKDIEITNYGYYLIEKIMIFLKFINKNDNLYINNNLILINYFIAILKSYIFFKKNIDYLVIDNKILLVDENTGRISYDRRISDGIHQGIEAKEKLKILEESKNISYITYQNYFKLYNKISGMTGTAFTETNEFKYIYNLNIIKIPLNNKNNRIDYNDSLYIKEESKINDIINDVLNCINNNRPVLIGTISIEKSELISKYLKKKNIKHNILNAKNNYVESYIISQAGKPSTVTISTNMAGRGTDIILGGD
ncbi:hypothetical protein L7J86_00360 [endosymbiont of Metamasius hemipterus]|uniref:SecA family profile domain-containing protein n=1 Tax=endosymbiont of Metamasius hemipterus TaxID=204627 RepID=A0ABT0TWF0_9GAMM|nr:hypothetical protein [endosymbiont of Metamasius hemipterus]